MPKVLPSGSIKYPCQPVFGTANFGNATIPPNCSIVFEVLSKLSTSTEHTNAFVPVPRGGAGAGTFQQPSPGSSGFDSPIGNGQAPDLVEFSVKDLNRNELRERDRLPGSRSRCDPCSWLYLPRDAMVIAVAAMAAVSARRMVGPREAASQPCFSNTSSSSPVQPPSGPIASRTSSSPAR